jgi:lipopolysaccharide biosynthesis glycosyltransferase
MYYYFFAGIFYDALVKKIIYLDIDTIVQHDLNVLYEQPATTTFTGCKCNVIIPYIQYQNQMNSIGLLNQVEIKYAGFINQNINKYDSYLNSGVLLINLDRLRNINLIDLFKCAHDNHFNDQDLLSFYF